MLHYVDLNSTIWDMHNVDYNGTRITYTKPALIGKKIWLLERADLGSMRCDKVIIIMVYGIKYEDEPISSSGVVLNMLKKLAW